MSKSVKVRAPNLDLIELAAVFGPPPVLRTENHEHYDALCAHFMSCFKPRDVFELKLVRDMVDAGWHQIRYKRHQTVGVERWYRQSLDFQVQRAKLQNARRQELVNRHAEVMTARPADIAHAVQVEEKGGEDSITDIDRILSRTPTELEHNRAIEKSMPFQADLEKLIASATVRFNNALELFEHYREGLGERLRRNAEKILNDADYEVIEGGLMQIASPPLVSSEEGNDDVETRDRS